MRCHCNTTAAAARLSYFVVQVSGVAAAVVQVSVVALVAAAAARTAGIAADDIAGSRYCLLGLRVEWSSALTSETPEAVVFLVLMRRK